MGIQKNPPENGNILDNTSRFSLFQDDYEICNVFHCSLHKKKNLAEQKKLKRALPNSPSHLKVVFGEDLLGSKRGVESAAICGHVFSCHLMSSHVIPWPKGENIVTEQFYKMLGLSQSSHIIPYYPVLPYESHLVTSKKW